MAFHPLGDRMRRNENTYLYILVGLTLIVSLLSYFHSAPSSGLVSFNSTTQAAIRQETALTASMNASLSNYIAQQNGGYTGLSQEVAEENANITAVQGEVGSLKTGESTISADLNYSVSSIDSNVSSLSSKVNSLPGTMSNLINTLQQIYLSNRTIIGYNTLTLNRSTYVIPASGYYYGIMLPDFSNHINFTANQSVNMDVMTIYQFAKFATNNTYSSSSTYSGSAQDIWWNESQDCNQYVYIIAGSGAAFNLTINDTAAYNPSASPTGACS